MLEYCILWVWAVIRRKTWFFIDRDLSVTVTIAKLHTDMLYSESSLCYGLCKKVIRRREDVRRQSLYRWNWPTPLIRVPITDESEDSKVNLVEEVGSISISRTTKFTCWNERWDKFHSTWSVCTPFLARTSFRLYPLGWTCDSSILCPRSCSTVWQLAEDLKELCVFCRQTGHSMLWP